MAVRHRLNPGHMVQRNGQHVPFLNFRTRRVNIFQDIADKRMMPQGTPFGRPVVPEVYINRVMASSSMSE